MQKHVNLVDLVKSFPTNIYLQNLASIQERTSPLKFAHLAEKSADGSVSNLSTKGRTQHKPGTAGEHPPPFEPRAGSLCYSTSQSATEIRLGPRPRYRFDNFCSISIWSPLLLEPQPPFGFSMFTAVSRNLCTYSNIYSVSITSIFSPRLSFPAFFPWHKLLQRNPKRSTSFFF